MLIQPDHGSEPTMPEYLESFAYAARSPLAVAIAMSRGQHSSIEQWVAGLESAKLKRLNQVTLNQSLQAGFRNPEAIRVLGEHFTRLEK